MSMENRDGVHVIASAAGLTYRETKAILMNIMLNTPDAARLARVLVYALKGGANA